MPPAAPLPFLLGLVVVVVGVLSSPSLCAADGTFPASPSSSYGPDVRPWMANPQTASPSQRAALLLQHMNLTDKISLLHGPPKGPCCECTTSPLCNYTGNVTPANPSLGIPSLKMNDGPQGFRDNNFPGTTTAWPSTLTVAASWDLDLVWRWGQAMGKEFHDKGANVQLGPGLCLARIPPNGRNFEYLAGEDPRLGYELVQPLVAAVQAQHVMAVAKHYVLNNQETNRGEVSDNADERTRFELYYPAFLGAVRAGAASVMCSYNKVYGKWACENEETLRTDLKERMGFNGFIMSDWGGTHSTSIRQGLDMEMPSADYFGDRLFALVESGIVSEKMLDESVLRVLTAMFRVGLFDFPNPNIRSNNVTSPAHNDLARKLSAASTVLLKNDRQVLPLNPASLRRVAVIGWADEGAFIHGGGSGSVAPSRIITPLMGITNRLSASSPSHLLSSHSTSSTSSVTVTFSPGRPGQHASAAAAAKASDVAIVFIGTTSSEGSDRTSLRVDQQGDELVMAVAAAQPNNNTIVVVSTPGAILTSPWAKSERVPAILTNFMPGQEVGNAIADILFGDINPSAKLPLTFPNKENEQNMTTNQYPGIPPDNPINANYTEGLFVGYRWYDQHNVTPAFPFGHGLSYTTFLYDHLHISPSSPSPFVNVAFTITNTGRREGAEVAQLYIGFPVSAKEPPRLLRCFKKVQLRPEQTEKVKCTLREEDLSVWDAERHAWTVVHGSFTVYVGSSSRDIRLSGSFTY
ncbi:Thermostable beta-glucosidase B [Balamuthia mandrillaris]